MSTAKKFRLAMCIAWVVNLAVFTMSLFLADYYEHQEHWMGESWRAVFRTAVISKCILTMALAFAQMCVAEEEAKERKDAAK